MMAHNFLLQICYSQLQYSCHVFLEYQEQNSPITMVTGQCKEANKFLDEGSICIMLLHKLHPHDVVECVPNHITTDRLSNLVTVKQGKWCRQGEGVRKVANFFTTPSIPDVKL
jgi:hypothetical protein